MDRGHDPLFTQILKEGSSVFQGLLVKEFELTLLSGKPKSHNGLPVKVGEYGGQIKISSSSSMFHKGTVGLWPSL